MRTQNNHGRGSGWSSRLNWVANHINKLWSPKHSRIDHDKQEKMEQAEIKNRVQNKKIELQAKIDGKTEILNKMRGKNKHELQHKLKRVSSYLSRQQSSQDKPCDLLCPICLQFFIKPVTTICGHNFCLRCLDQTLLFKTDCPNCRHFIRGSRLIECESLDKIIQRIIYKYREQEVQLYEQYVCDTKQWEQQRTLKEQDIAIEQIIDVRDTEYIWCKAQIKQIYYSSNGGDRIQQILVHYLGWNNIYDQIISVGSDRVSRGGFYTDRDEIPHYKNNTNEESRMYSFVVNGYNDMLIGNLDHTIANSIADHQYYPYYYNYNNGQVELEYSNNNSNNSDGHLQVIQQVQIEQQHQQQQHNNNNNNNNSSNNNNVQQQYMNEQDNNMLYDNDDIDDNNMYIQQSNRHIQQDGQRQIQKQSNYNRHQYNPQQQQQQQHQQQQQQQIEVEQEIINIGPFIFSINNQYNTATYLKAQTLPLHSQQPYSYQQQQQYKQNKQNNQQLQQYKLINVNHNYNTQQHICQQLHPHTKYQIYYSQSNNNTNLNTHTNHNQDTSLI